jgi:hypothetical protein
LDTVDEEKGNAFRMQVLFWTGQASRKGLMSEYRSHTDRARLKKGVAVRIPLSFRQGKPQKKDG